MNLLLLALAVTAIGVRVPAIDPNPGEPFVEILSGTAVPARAGRLQAAGTPAITLEQALKDLHADVQPKRVKVTLPADGLFDTDKAELKKDADPQLDKLVAIVKAYPKATVVVDSHTDNKGNSAANQTLSEKRAATVAHWLASNAGLKPSQIRPKGWGKSRPIAPNGTPDGRARNRRIEITILRS